jgi:hypothetical protein
LKVGSLRKLLMKIGHGAGRPSGPAVKFDARLSRMLGRGLVESVVLVPVGINVPTAIEKVVVTEPPSDVLEGCVEDSVDSGGSVVSCLRILRPLVSCSGSLFHLCPS